MEYDSLKDIVTKLPIFGTFSLQIKEPDKNDFFKLSKKTIDLLNICFHTDKIRIKCIECESECPFSVSFNVEQYKKSGTYLYRFMSGLNYVRRECSIHDDEMLNHEIQLADFDEGIIEYTFRCTMNEFHYQKMYLLYTLDNGLITFRKIGQKPMNTDLVDKYSNDYKSILSKYDALDDFRHFEQSESRNLLAGSCTYLRRIFEKMVNKMLLNPKISEDQRKNAHRFEDKIKLVKDQFDDDIIDILTSSYSLLSRGIHELDNNEIDQFYSLMLELICTQLEYENSATIKSKRKNELKKNINFAVQKYKK